MGRKPEVLPSVSSWEAMYMWVERIGQAKLRVWTGRRKMDSEKHRIEEKAEGNSEHQSQKWGSQ